MKFVNKTIGNLFLDLNPNDENAIRLYNEYRKEKDICSKQCH